MNYRINGLKCCLVISLLAISNLVYAQSCYTIFDTAIRQTSGTFVWKPVSEGNGKLVVLFPSTSSATGATLRFGGSVIANGSFSGRTNGDRPTIRFGAPGGAYPDGLQVCEAFGGSAPPPTPAPTPAPAPAPTPAAPEPVDVSPIINILLN